MSLEEKSFMLRKIIFVIVVTAVVACENAKEEKTKLTKAQITGFYEQKGEGEIIEFNELLETNPEKVNEDPYGEGWMIKVKIDSSDLSDLLDADDYNQLIG